MNFMANVLKALDGRTYRMQQKTLRERQLSFTDAPPPK